MIEKIGILASILGILGTIWAFIKFVFNPYFKNREEYKNICIVVNDSYKRWKDLSFSARGGAMISHDDFLTVNKYRHKFKKKNSEIRAYLLRNAIQNGLGGNWGFWLDMNKNNSNILLPLFLILDKSAGLRPLWRSAFILEKIFLRNINELDRFVTENKRISTNDKSILEIIRNNSVETEMLKLVKQGTKEEKTKIKYVIEECKTFSKEIDDFTKEQSIIKNK